MKKLVALVVLCTAMATAQTPVGPLGPPVPPEFLPPKPKVVKLRPFVPGHVAVLKSEATFQALGWRSRWEWQGGVKTLRALGLTVDIVAPATLLRGSPGRLLILPNCRNLDLATVNAIQRHIDRGGRILATYQTSYRKADSSSWNPNNFALSRQLGIRFKRWAGTPPDAAHMLWENGLNLELPRNQAMIFEPLENATVLATWDRPEKAPAAVETKAGIYLGEDLLAPEMSRSSVVLHQLMQLLHRLDPSLKLTAFKIPAMEAPAPPYLPFAGHSATLRIGLGTSGPLRVRAHSGNLLGRGGREVVVRAIAADTLQVLSSDAHHTEAPSLKLEASDYLDVWTELENGTCRWRAYRGSLECTATTEGMSVINQLPVDSYLAGVVPSEVPPTFPDEALKAMAVVARTYSLSHLGRHKGYDLCSEVHCQVYRGLAQEAASTTQAVFTTVGEVVMAAGKPADASFSACCGGQGVNVEMAWPRYAPSSYLVGQTDGEAAAPDLSLEANLRAWMDSPPACYCSAAGRFRWEENFRWKELQDRLTPALPQPVGEITNVTVASRDKTGHIRELLIQGSTGNCTVGNDSVRWLTSGGKIGAGGLNSSLFYLDSLGVGEERTLHIKGAGWGHGVGMCQEGAAGRARAGQNYLAIINHYYPGTIVMTDPPAGVAP